jgi:hypothetical protein
MVTALFGMRKINSRATPIARNTVEGGWFKAYHMPPFMSFDVDANGADAGFVNHLIRSPLFIAGWHRLNPLQSTSKKKLSLDDDGLFHFSKWYKPNAYTLKEMSGVADELYKLHVEHLGNQREHYFDLERKLPKVAAACLIGSISFDDKENRLVKTNAKILGEDEPKEYLNLMTV